MLNLMLNVFKYPSIFAMEGGWYDEVRTFDDCKCFLKRWFGYSSLIFLDGI